MIKNIFISISLVFLFNGCVKNELNIPNSKENITKKEEKIVDPVSIAFGWAGFIMVVMAF